MVASSIGEQTSAVLAVSAEDWRQTHLRGKEKVLAPVRGCLNIRLFRLAFLNLSFSFCACSSSVVMYQMTGKLPLSKDVYPEFAEPAQLVHAILDRVPASVHVVNGSVRKVLSSIVMKAMEVSLARRGIPTGSTLVIQGSRDRPFQIAQTAQREDSRVVLCSLHVQKNPDDRYKSAFGLFVDLRSCAQCIQAAEMYHGAGLAPGSIRFQVHVPPFELGFWDHAATFALSKKLYGREVAAQTLTQALDHMLTSRKTTVVAIRGMPGSGKTALVQSVFSPLLNGKSLLFVTSKLAEHHRQPFACLKQVTNQLLLHFLTLNSAKLAAWKEKTLELFAGNGSLITQLFPVLGVNNRSWAERCRGDTTSKRTHQHDRCVVSCQSDNGSHVCRASIT